MSILSAPADSASSITDPIAATIKNPFSTTVKNNGERPIDFPGGFTITEYVNGAPVNSTVIRLVGNLMPHQPFPWEGEQRIVKQYYPGNPEPNMQIFGPKENDVTIKGRFKDKRYKDPSYYGVSYLYARSCDEMRKRGNLLKFGMTGPAGQWLRYGYLEKVSFKMAKLSWVDYELTFSIIGEKQPINNYFAAQEKNAPNNINQNLLNSAAAFQSSYSSCPKTMPQSLAGLINGLTSDVAKNINLVTGFVGTVISTGASVVAAANRALGLIKNAQATISAYKRQLGLVNYNSATLSSSGNSVSQFSDTYANIRFISNAQKGSSSMASILDQLKSQFAALALTVPKARYKVSQGDTLQKISIKFYGVMDNWIDIYNHNHLQNTALVIGSVLEIPNL